MRKLRLSTCSLAGCFGCHMSLLDIDERLLELLEHIEFQHTPITDLKAIVPSDIGLVEGAVANSENLKIAQAFRKNCKTLVAMGACAVNGGIPSMRNQFSLRECLEESYISGIGVEEAQIPNDPEIPLLLNKVHPVHEVVKVDYTLPGCPPSADTIWTFLSELIEGKSISFPYTQIHYD